ncbi:DcaP family trimeric outer membrane transporter [Methylomonas methanica]|uniref:Porin n=1 Tax=Methylomonas methanica (strain DSM 25384 / MC09) TaxID=857087 RepID=F9ZVY6_METMM|nr:DcaP family trimeric outer membrane transporter [Methylomonas methanica]AEG00790.1 porin [Methylomonas methanica MC09]
MINRYPVLSLMLVLGGLPNDTSAEQDLRELVMQLNNQIKALQSQVVQSNARIDELEQKLLNSKVEKQHSIADSAAGAQATLVTARQSAAAYKQPEPAKPPVSAGDIKGTLKLPGTDTSIGFGGYIKLDTLFSSNGMGKDKLGNQRLEAAEIPVGTASAGENDQISMHAKESRFWIKSLTPSHWGDMNTYLEFDFFGDPAAYTYTPRLRHAYGSLGRLLAGQTWSTFLNSLAIVDTLDNSNSVGSLLTLRQPQVRWTQPFSFGGAAMEWQLAVEAPRSRVWEARTQVMTTNSAGHYPDLIARLNFIPDWGNISLAAMGRQLRFSSSGLNVEKTVWGGAVNLAGKINTFGSDNLRFMFGYGDAFGRYAVNNFFADGYVNGAGEFDTLVSYSSMLAYQHWWDKSWRSTVAYGFARADQPGFAGNANHQTQSLHANLLWSPVLQTTIGLEYIYANRELVNGQNGELNRVQLSTRFNF